ncbi:hypothetical protein J7K50_09225 [bacterium]|nr:hypothetical protein [bacterium]
MPLALVLALALSACESTGGTSSSNPIAGFSASDTDEIVYDVVLGIPPAESSEFGDKAVLSLVPTEDEGGFILTADGTDVRVCYATINYNADSIRFIGAFGGEVNPAIFAAIEVRPGTVHIGWAIPDFDEKSGPSGKTTLMNLKFGIGGVLEIRDISKVPDSEGHAVDDLESEWTEDGLSITFYERNPGDYDRGGEVGVPDITPIAQNYLAEVNSEDENDTLVVIDGDGSGEIGIPDITLIAENYLSDIEGYALQFSVDGGVNWIPDEPAITGLEGVPLYVRDDSAFVTIDQCYQFPRWTILIPIEEVFEYQIPGLDPGNDNMLVRVYPTDGEGVGPGSNEAEISIISEGDTEPPQWVDTEGLTLLDPVSNFNTLQLEFGEAVDDSGEDVVYRIYYAKSAEFDSHYAELEENPDAIGFTEIWPRYDEMPPYSHELVGLEPGQEYKVLVRARDDAFPDMNIDSNTNIGTVVVDEHSLLLSEILWAKSGDSGEPANGDVIELSVEITGGTGEISTVWSDERPDAGYFVGDGILEGNVATNMWGTALGSEWYTIRISATDAEERNGMQETSFYVGWQPIPSFNDDIYSIIEASCISCHGIGGASGLDMSNTSTAFENLVNESSAQVPEIYRIEPFEPGQSYLICKLLDGCPINTGVRMPKDADPLPESEFLDILRWVYTGANEGAPDPTKIYFAAPILRLVSGEDPVSEIPAGFLGEISIPFISEFTAPLTAEVSDDSDHCDAFIDPGDFYDEEVLWIMVGGDSAGTYSVVLDVEDAEGKTGHLEIPVAITGSGARLLSYEAHIEPLIIPRCAACHGAVPPVMTEGEGYGNLVGQPSSQDGIDYVTPVNMTKSYIVFKTMGWSPAGPEPHHVDPDDDEDIGQFLVPIAEWIIGGALP